MAKKKKDEKQTKTEFDKALAQIEKNFGKGVVIDLDSKALNVKSISSGTINDPPRLMIIRFSIKK